MPLGPVTIPAQIDALGSIDRRPIVHLPVNPAQSNAAGSITGKLIY